MENNNKHIIWSNIDLDIEDWREVYSEYLEINEMDDDPADEDAIYSWMCDTNWEYYHCEECNLDKQLEGEIICIADLGLWDGRHQGYKVLTRNLNDVLHFSSRGFDYAEIYADRYDIKATEHHHDGTNHYLFRMLRPNMNHDPFLKKLYDGEEITRKYLNYHTQSLRKYVADVYGW